MFAVADVAFGPGAEAPPAALAGAAAFFGGAACAVGLAVTCASAAFAGPLGAGVILAEALAGEAAAGGAEEAVCFAGTAVTFAEAAAGRFAVEVVGLATGAVVDGALAEAGGAVDLAATEFFAVDFSPSDVVAAVDLTGGCAVGVLSLDLDRDLPGGGTEGSLA